MEPPPPNQLTLLLLKQMATSLMNFYILNFVALGTSGAKGYDQKLKTEPTQESLLARVFPIVQSTTNHSGKKGAIKTLPMKNSY